MKKILKSLGCSDTFLDKLFPSNFNKMIHSIIRGDLDDVKYYH